MLKLIIADDERIIRESIMNLISWDNLNIQLVGCCRNGLEAFQMILEKKPDIVLTDIKMPGMSGLELIKKISDEQLVIEFIIMSGYEDFKFAREAIHYKIHHYLLKPCNEEDIINAIKEASAELLKRKQFSSFLVAPPSITQNPQNYSDFIQKVILYIKEHYADPTISLKGISENYLFMNPDYVSRQFSIQTGQKFLDYLIELRIKKAKWLLLSGVVDKNIAEKIGYGNNPQYFNQLFKKITGLSPKTYIKVMRDNNNEEL
jgi:two-component system response regulator YesN